MANPIKKGAKKVRKTVKGATKAVKKTVTTLKAANPFPKITAALKQGSKTAKRARRE